MAKTKKVFVHTNWLLPEKENPRDFLLGDLWLDVSKLPDIKGTLPLYNQYKSAKSRSACTIVNAFRQWCHICGVKPTDRDYADLINWCVKYCWYIIGQWRWTEEAMNAVLKRTRQMYPTILCHYAKVNWADGNVEILLDKWYSMWVSYGGNQAYNEDYQKDNILNGAVFWTPTYGHRTCLIKKGNHKIDDSWYWTSFNIYSLAQFKALFQNSVYNPRIYVWIKDSGINEAEVKRLTSMRWYCQEANKYLDLCKQITNSDEIYKANCQEMINVNAAKIQTINTILASKDTSTLI